VQALSALADPIRRQIVEMLADGEQDAGELASAFPVSRPAVSRHLRVLREAGLVLVRKEAQQRIYAVNPVTIAELDAWLTPYRKLWNEPLDALGDHLDNDREQEEQK
jgi:DNA-binding transcriptional ArsR family regulator